MNEVKSNKQLAEMTFDGMVKRHRRMVYLALLEGGINAARVTVMQCVEEMKLWSAGGLSTGHLRLAPGTEDNLLMAVIDGLSVGGGDGIESNIRMHASAILRVLERQKLMAA